jgi:membrane fusion protein, multidrug efflux system
VVSKRLLVLLCSLGAACWAHAQGSGPGPAAPQQAPAPAADARMSTLERQQIRAQLLPRRYTTVAAEIGARISRISVQEGQRFGAGQVLVVFDCSTQEALLAKAQAEQAAAEVTLAANQRLNELNSVGKVELDLSAVAVRKFAADVAAQQTLLAKCRVPAPFAGRVAEQHAREQQFVQAGQPLLDILDDSVLELEFLVPSRWLAWLKVGHRFEVRIDETQKTYPAKMTRMGARVDPVSQSLKVVAAIDGRFPDLMAGMSGQVLITSP